jgi:hypothetical protein
VLLQGKNGTAGNPQCCITRSFRQWRYNTASGRACTEVRRPADTAKSGMSEERISRGQFSWGGALGARAGTAYRLLRGRPGRNKRLLAGAKAGAASFGKPLMRVLRVLFLEASGVIFLVISLSVTGAFIREYKKYELHQVGWERMALAGVLGVMFFYFGVTSFWRAHRKRSKV